MESHPEPAHGRNERNDPGWDGVVERKTDDCVRGYADSEGNKNKEKFAATASAYLWRVDAHWSAPFAGGWCLRVGAAGRFSCGVGLGCVRLRGGVRVGARLWCWCDRLCEFFDARFGVIQ